MSPVSGQAGERDSGGNPLRAVWIVADRLIYNVMAQPG
jgi:hypothetical protein